MKGTQRPLLQRIKITCGAGRSHWTWTAHQITVLPTIGIIDSSHYYGYLSMTVVATWLAWGAWINVKLFD